MCAYAVGMILHRVAKGSIYIYENFVIYTHTCHFAWEIRIGVFYTMRAPLHRENIKSVCECSTVRNDDDPNYFFFFFS